MSDVRFGITVESDNGHHVRLRLFAATDGQHLGGCGPLSMTTAEYTRFRELLKPSLTDRPDPAPEVTPELQHRMVPGSHERPGGAECLCGALWDRWSDECGANPTTKDA